MIVVVSRDQLPYITITWSTAVDHEKYRTPCYRAEYANSDRIKYNVTDLVKFFLLPDTFSISLGDDLQQLSLFGFLSLNIRLVLSCQLKQKCQINSPSWNLSDSITLKIGHFYMETNCTRSAMNSWCFSNSIFIFHIKCYTGRDY